MKRYKLNCLFCGEEESALIHLSVPEGIYCSNTDCDYHDEPMPLDAVKQQCEFWLGYIGEIDCMLSIEAAEKEREEASNES